MEVVDTFKFAAVLIAPSMVAVVVATELLKLTAASISNTSIRVVPIAPEKVLSVPVTCKVPSPAEAPSTVPAMVTELSSAKMIFELPVLSSKVMSVDVSA